MGMVNMYRYFDQAGVPGVRPYKRMHSRMTKAEATKFAVSCRKHGNKVRVIKEADGYVTFVLLKSRGK